MLGRNGRECKLRVRADVRREPSQLRGGDYVGYFYAGAAISRRALRDGAEGPLKDAGVTLAVRREYQ